MSRGYIGVALRDVDADLQGSLKLPVSRGALVQDVTPGSPGDRAGLRPYDVIVALDGKAQQSDEQLIRDISASAPGTAVRLRVLQKRTRRGCHRQARGAARAASCSPTTPALAAGDRTRGGGDAALGLTVRDLDRQTTDRLNLPSGDQGRVDHRASSRSAPLPTAGSAAGSSCWRSTGRRSTRPTPTGASPARFRRAMS